MTINSKKIIRSRIDRRFAYSASILAFAALICFLPVSRGSSTPPLAMEDQIMPINDALCNDMKVHHVLNRGPVVGCDRLKFIKFGYIGFDGQTHDDGEIVVMDAVSDYVARIFSGLRRISFPIAKAKLMNAYDGNDDASMADNNTSSFNDREIVGGGAMSLHAYGLAIDLNPVQNPYAKRLGATLVFSPKAGISYANRLNDRPWRRPRSGMAETAIDVFADNGFLIWGGYWDNPIDYQHFQVCRNLADRLAHLSPAEAQRLFERHVEQYLTCRKARDQTDSNRSFCIAAQDATDGSGAE
jgi:hypothetical protein